MMTFVLVLALLATVITIMAVGVIFASKPIKGSCGGIAAIGMNTECDICGGKPEDCDKESLSVEQQAALTARQAQQDLAYDASSKKI